MILSFCLKRNAVSVVLTMLGGRDTPSLLDGQFLLNFMHFQGFKNFPLALALPLSHLVKLSLPNIW